MTAGQVKSFDIEPGRNSVRAGSTILDDDNHGTGDVGARQGVGKETVEKGFEIVVRQCVRRGRAGIGRLRRSGMSWCKQAKGE
jgi:hypothetical protein